MPDRALIEEWLRFSDLDYRTAEHLYENMIPKPLEIICYHCQQSIEKLLKAFQISVGIEVEKTHDLSLLMESLSEQLDIDDEHLRMCINLNPYGVRVRYPQELQIEERHAKKALDETSILRVWLLDNLPSVN